MTNSREQLTQQERALADRLSRISGTGGPSPALDARILSAAQAAVTTQPENADHPPTDTKAAGGVTNIQRSAAKNTKPRRTSRWGWSLGLAASLMLAVGVAWQLRPQHKPAVVYETAPAPATPAFSIAPSQARATPIAQPFSATAASKRVTQSLAPVPRRPTPPARAKTLPLPAKPPIGTMAERGPGHLARLQQLRATIPATQQSPAIADNARPLIKTQSRSLAAAAAANASEDASVIMHAAVDQDTLLPADAWLRAIRRHRFEGQGALARASLQAFRDAHPDQAIPEDLRALLP